MSGTLDGTQPTSVESAAVAVPPSPTGSATGDVLSAVPKVNAWTKPLGGSTKPPSKSSQVRVALCSLIRRSFPFLLPPEVLPSLTLAVVFQWLSQEDPSTSPAAASSPTSTTQNTSDAPASTGSDVALPPVSPTSPVDPVATASDGQAKPRVSAWKTPKTPDQTDRPAGSAVDSVAPMPPSAPATSGWSSLVSTIASVLESLQ